MGRLLLLDAACVKPANEGFEQEQIKALDILAEAMTLGLVVPNEEYLRYHREELPNTYFSQRIHSSIIVERENKGEDVIERAHRQYQRAFGQGAGLLAYAGDMKVGEHLHQALNHLRARSNQKYWQIIVTQENRLILEHKYDTITVPDLLPESAKVIVKHL